MSDMLKEMARALVTARELLGFVTHPILAPLMEAAFDHELRRSRETAQALGWVGGIRTGPEPNSTYALMPAGRRK